RSISAAREASDNGSEESDSAERRFAVTQASSLFRPAGLSARSISFADKMSVLQHRRDAYVTEHCAKSCSPACRVNQLLLLHESCGSPAGSDTGGVEVSFNERQRSA